jgi:Icc-related predicted phosphoesterase
MDRLSLIFRTDVHVADKSPLSWKGDYPAEIWSNLEQIGDLARKHNCTAVLDGGDYFHVKAPTRNSHAIVAKSAQIHGAYPCPTWCIEGNHDIKHNNLDTLDRQPLGVLFESGTFQHLRDTTFQVGSLKVRVVGFPYSPFRTLEELRAVTKGEEDYLVAIVHALAAENPPAHVEEFFGEPVFRYSDLVFKAGPDIFCFGHWHQDQGIVEIQGRQFVNQGAVSRGALTKENTSRVPKVALLEFTPSGFTVGSIPLKVLPASEVFDLERKERQERERRSIDHFVSEISEKVFQVDVEQDIEGGVRSLDFAVEVRDRALTYLENASNR